MTNKKPIIKLGALMRNEDKEAFVKKWSKDFTIVLDDSVGFVEFEGEGILKISSSK